MIKLVEEWLTFAKMDLLTIEKLLGELRLTPVVAFHAQQCIEKSFKAVILYYTEEIPRVHNLLMLHGTVKKFLQIPLNSEILTMINETYTDARYPAEIGIDGINLPSLKTANLFYEEAQKIYHFIYEKLSDDGKSNL